MEFAGHFLLNINHVIRATNLNNATLYVLLESYHQIAVFNKVVFIWLVANLFIYLIALSYNNKNKWSKIPTKNSNFQIPAFDNPGWTAKHYSSKRITMESLNNT